jgi:hypothetical protein
MKTSEADVREMLERRAKAFSMDPDPPEAIGARARRRTSRNVALAAASLTSIGVVVVLLVGAIGALRTPGGVGTPSGTHVKLVSYFLPDTSDGATGPNAGSELSDHIACMRAQGFDIPDPVRTDDGWSIPVDPSVVDVGSAAWREAAFVTCRLPMPASGNVILGLSKERVDRFVACVSDQGFDLPQPTLNHDGEYVFDLTGTDIDVSSTAWNEAAFVTCSPDVGP